MLRSKTGSKAILVSLLILLGISWTHLATSATGQLIPTPSSPENCVKPQASSGNLTLDICTSKVHYNFGEVVDIVLTLTNTGPTPLQLDTFSFSIFVVDRLDAPKLSLSRLQLVLLHT